MSICQAGETTRQVQVRAEDTGEGRHRTTLAGEGHAAAPSQISLVREEQAGILFQSVQTRHSTTVNKPSICQSGAEHRPTVSRQFEIHGSPELTSGQFGIHVSTEATSRLAGSNGFSVKSSDLPTYEGK